MIFKEFIDRKDYLSRLQTALGRTNPQFIVIYGRRRIGKSELIKHALLADQKNIYFLSDQTSENNQRSLFAKSVALTIEDFDKVTYPDWETLLRALNRQLNERKIICLDEFPYLAKTCPSLPSVIQKLLNEKSLKFDLIICGSSQQLMHGFVMNRNEPLYGLADEIIKLTPIPVSFMNQAIPSSAVNAIEEYAVWGGIPRYWELRADYKDLDTAIRRLLLDNKGFLAEEPIRLLRDDMRDIIQSSTILSIVGNGCNRLSEIASRCGKETTQITEPLGKLRELGYIRREIPYGESEKSSRKGIYRIDDPLLSFYYRFIAPNKSILELGRIETVMKIIKEQFSKFVGDYWEQLCRDYVSGNELDGIIYGRSSRWWGKIFTDEENKGEMVEFDIVAESFDKKHVFLGECKWSKSEDAVQLLSDLKRKVPFLPFVKDGQQVHIALFLKNKPSKEAEDSIIFYPGDILTYDFETTD